MAICVECEWCHDCLDGTEITCKNPNLPVTDFVRGSRYCVILNLKGDCKGFKKPECESIYESKSDEELAKIPREDDD